MADAAAMEPCLGCTFVSGDEEPVGGELLRTERWMVNHCVGPLGLGTVVIAPLRHVTRVSELTDAEAEELGTLIRRCCQVIESLATAQQTYVCLWSHGPDGPRHLHSVVQPITRELVGQYGGRRSEELQLAMFEAAEYPDPTAVEGFCAQARGLLARA